MRVGRERREKMRAHLLQSVLQVCSAQAGGTVVIDDVVRHAKVARGTFYKYFDTLDRAMAELGAQLAEEMTEDIYGVYDVLQEPVMRTATGFQMFLLRAMMEPEWGSFIAHIGLLSSDNLMTRKITDDIRLGVDTGDYVVPSIQIASDVLMGAKVEAIRRLILGDGTTIYIRGVASMVLRSFGVTAAHADNTVLRAFDRLCEQAPEAIGWWRPSLTT